MDAIAAILSSGTSFRLLEIEMSYLWEAYVFAVYGVVAKLQVITYKNL